MEKEQAEITEDYQISGIMKTKGCGTHGRTGQSPPGDRHGGHRAGRAVRAADGGCAGGRRIQKANGLSIFDAAREAVVLDKAEARIQDAALCPDTADHVQHMMDVAKQCRGRGAGRRRPSGDWRIAGALIIVGGYRQHSDRSGSDFRAGSRRLNVRSGYFDAFGYGFRIDLSDCSG